MIHVDAELDYTFRKKFLLTYISTFLTLNLSLGLITEVVNFYSRTSIMITIEKASIQANASGAKGRKHLIRIDSRRMPD